ncbi:MAG: hypothetical protein ABF636_04945 [Acetobacter sp.]
MACRARHGEAAWAWIWERAWRGAGTALAWHGVANGCVCGPAGRGVMPRF